jgi:hypothetical protein
LGCKKVVVAQPYELSETTRIASYSLRFGCEVLGATAGTAPSTDWMDSSQGCARNGSRIDVPAPGRGFDPASVAALADHRGVMTALQVVWHTLQA